MSRFTAETMAMTKAALGVAYSDSNLSKASVSTASGLTYYDLAAPAKLLVPLNLTPLVDRTPRKKRPNGSGTAAHWKSILAVTGSGFDNIGFVPEGARSGTLSYAATDVLATYTTLGEEGSLTFEAESAAEGFEDANAQLSLIELLKFRRKEEIAILGANKTIHLGTPSTPTASAAGSGGTIPATNTYYVSVVLLTQEGYSNFKSGGSVSVIQQKTVTGADGKTYSVNGGSSAASTAVSQSVTSGQILTANATYKAGAVAYAWYVGLVGAQTLQKVTTTSTTTFSSLTTNLQSLTAITQDCSYNDGTGGTNPVTGFDGFMYTAMASGSNAYVANVAGTLTASGSGTVVEIDTALQTMWDTYRVSPTIIWVNSQQLTDIRNKCMANASTPLLRINHDASAGPYDLKAGGTITTYFNPYGLNGGQSIPVMLHPDVAPGTILMYCEQLPTYYASNATPVVAEVLTRRDYYRIDWPLTTRERQYGIYAEEVLAVYAPFAMGILTNITAG